MKTIKEILQCAMRNKDAHVIKAMAIITGVILGWFSIGVGFHSWLLLILSGTLGMIYVIGTLGCVIIAAADEEGFDFGKIGK